MKSREEFEEQLLNEDPIEVLSILNISSEELVDAFQHLVQFKYDSIYGNDEYPEEDYE